MALMQCMHFTQLLSSMVSSDAVPLDALGGAVAADVPLDVHAIRGSSPDFGLVDTDVVPPGADDGHIGPGDGGHAVVGAAGELELELVREGRTVELVLEVLRDVVAGAMVS